MCTLTGLASGLPRLPPCLALGLGAITVSLHSYIVIVFRPAIIFYLLPAYDTNTKYSHYLHTTDPTLGCTGSSSMTTECAALGRTLADGYVYACTPAGFASGLHYQCEIGDIAAKLGDFVKESSDSGEVIFSGSMNDPFPPSAINFGSADGIATSWMSIVAHCPSSGARLFCAQFQSVTCSDSSGGSSEEDDDELSALEWGYVLIGSILGVAFLVVFVFIYVLGCRVPSGSDKKTILSSEQL